MIDLSISFNLMFGAPSSVEFLGYFLPFLKMAFSRPIVGASNTNEAINAAPYEMHI